MPARIGQVCVVLPICSKHRPLFFIARFGVGGDVPVELGDIGEFDPLLGAVLSPLDFGEDVGVLGAPGEFTAEHFSEGAFFVDEDGDLEVFLRRLDEEAIFVFEIGDVAFEVVAAFDADVESTGCGMVGLDELEEPVVFELDEGDPVQFEAGFGFLDHDRDGELPVWASDHEDGLHAAADFGVWIVTDEAEVGDGNGCGRELAVVAFDVGVHLFVFGAEDVFALGFEGVAVEELEQGVCGGFSFRGDVGDGSQTGRRTGDAGIGGASIGTTWNLHETGLGWRWGRKFAGEGRCGRFDDLWSHGPGIGWSRGL